MKQLTALKTKYEAEMLIAKCNIDTYIESSVGIGEHPDLVEAIDTQVRRYNEAKELHSTIEELIEKYVSHMG